MDAEVRRLCKSAFDGEIDIGVAVARLKEQCKGRKREELSLVVSCTLFALWDLCGEGDAAEEACQSRCALLARELYQSGVLDEDVWLSTAEWDLLEASETVANVADDKRREVRYYTRVVYVQTRFNLASECPTGFARLFSLMQRLTTDPVMQLRRDLCRLVGELKIEPHRVLDALLEFLPPTKHASHQLLTLFDANKVGHIMGRKLRAWQSDPAPNETETEVERRPDKLQRTTRAGRGDDLRLAKEISQKTPTEKRPSTPRRYFHLCAALEVEGYLDVSVVFRYLAPSLKETCQRTDVVVESIRKATHEQRFPNLNRPLPEQRSRMTEKDRDVHSVYRDPKKFSYQPLRLEELQAEASTEEDPFLRLAAGFLESSQPGKALRILRCLNDFFCSEVREGCLSVVERVIDPFFRKFPSNARSLDKFLDDVKSPLFPCLRTAAPAVFEWLAVTGYRLHLNLELFRKAALVMLHEVRFYGHPSYVEASLRGYPAPKRHSVEYMISTVFLPSLLMMDARQGLEGAAWIDVLVKMCSYTVRVMLFVHFEEVVAKTAVLDRCVAMAETAARHLVKILVTAQDTEAFETKVVPILDSIGKIAIRAPFHVTQVMVQKVQTDVMAAKDLSTAMLFFTPLAFSAFAHHFVFEMISTGTVRKHNDGRICQWYRNTLTFLGHVAHDYPEMLPLHFIVQNVLKEISTTEVIHVHILRELVHSMTGFQHCSEIGNSQFATLSGGPMLKSIGLVTPWQKDEAGYNTSVVALKKTLMLLPRNDRSAQGDMSLRLGGHMFVLLMKFLDYVPVRGDFAEVSSIMEMHSAVLGAFLAYVEFLSVYCTAQEFSEMLPPVDYVLNVLNLPMHYVSHLYRPSIAELRVVQGGSRRIPTPTTQQSLKLLQSIVQRFDFMSTSTDVEMQDASAESLTDPEAFLKALDRSGIANLDSFLFQKYGLTYVRTFYDFVEDLSKSRSFIQKGVWDVMSTEFYAFFWSLKLNDITISDTEYKKQMSQIQDEITGQEHETRSETVVHHLEHKLASLKAEREMQQTHVKFCRDFIRSRQAHLLSQVPTEKLRSFVDAFVQLCLYPRIRLGHEDALFAFEFILFMTKMGVENFPTLFILDKVVKELFPCLICMTDNEAEGFANFMYEFLRQMERWRSNKALFHREFGYLPGALEDPYTPGSTALVTHSNFLKVMAKWSNVIARLLKECLCPHEAEEKDKGQEKQIVDSVKHRKIMRRPALLVLDRLIPIFPTLTGLARHLRSALVYVTEYDSDEGMKTSAKAALARLDIEMESNRRGRWLGLNDYNISPKDPENANHQEAPHDMTPQEINSVLQMETESKEVPIREEETLQEMQKSPWQSPKEMEVREEAEDGLIPDPHKEVEEGLVLGVHKEEGELEKSTARRMDRRGRKQAEEPSKRTRNRKRNVGTVDSVPEAVPQDQTLRRSSTREETPQKREGSLRHESEKEPRRVKTNRREDPGRRKT